MIRLSQRDPRWIAVKIGKSPYTIGQYGCTLTCVSMASDYYNEYKNPEWMAKNLSYTLDGRILWQSIAKKTGFKFLWRFYTFDKSTIAEAIKNPKKVCLLNVDRGYHWVLAIKAIPLTNSYIVANPWTGKSEIYSGVVGGAILTK